MRPVLFGTYLSLATTTSNHLIGRHRIYQPIKGTKQQEETDSDKSSDDE